MLFKLHVNSGGNDGKVKLWDVIILKITTITEICLKNLN
jgi:hypothetical protein